MSLFSSFAAASFEADTEKYIEGIWTMVPKYIDGVDSANTGLSYDKVRRLIYSSITPKSVVWAFNENYEFQFELPIPTRQGFAYDHNRELFIIWMLGGSWAGLTTYDYSGNQLHLQVDRIDRLQAANSGSVCYDYVDDRLLFTWDGASDVLIYKRDGDDWIFERELGAVNPQEGITFDENTNTYWYNRKDVIVNISKQGVELKTIPQISETINENEGLAWNPHKNTIYVNSDKDYHGDIPNGNRCAELNPKYYYKY